MRACPTAGPAMLLSKPRMERFTLEPSRFSFSDVENTTRMYTGESQGMDTRGPSLRDGGRATERARAKSQGDFKDPSKVVYPLFLLY